MRVQIRGNALGRYLGVIAQVEVLYGLDGQHYINPEPGQFRHGRPFYWPVERLVELPPADLDLTNPEGVLAWLAT